MLNSANLFLSPMPVVFQNLLVKKIKRNSSQIPDNINILGVEKTPALNTTSLFTPISIVFPLPSISTFVQTVLICLSYFSIYEDTVHSNYLFVCIEQYLGDENLQQKF